MTDLGHIKTEEPMDRNEFSIWRRIYASHRSMNRVVALTSAFAVFVLMFLISADVIGRSIFDKPLMGTYEIGQNLMVYIVFFGLAYTQMVGGNVTVETFIRGFNSRTRLLLSLLATAIGFIMFAFMTYASSKLAWHAYVDGRTVQGLLGLPLYLSKSVVTLGAGLLTLHFLIDLIDKIKKLVFGSRRDVSYE
jgi:TRAP-type C4-dicarboxylate transport system permease small subunit